MRFSATSTHAPTPQAAAAGILATNTGSACEYEPATPAAPCRLDMPYTDEEYAAAAQADRRALTKKAPGCSFVLWEDPKYDWLGRYTPTPRD